VNKKDLQTLQNIKEVLASDELEVHVQDAVIQDPAREVEQSLVSFVTYRFNKVRESISYEEDIKDVIMSRINEATFPQLITLLQTVQSGNAQTMGTLFAPFIDQSNGRTLPENLRASQQEDLSIGATVHKSADNKQTLQAFTALYQVLDHLAAQEKNKDETSQ
jgi:hypothetical protein